MTKNITILFLFLLSFFSYPKKVHAQTNNYLSITFRDSLIADAKSNFLYNQVEIVNNYNQALNFDCTVMCPNGWNLLSRNNLALELSPGMRYMLSLTLGRTRNTQAKWETGKILLRLKNRPDSIMKEFQVSSASIDKFRAGTLLKEIFLTKNMRSVNLPLRIINYGNEQDTFQLYYSNQNLDINKTIEFMLKPGEDSTINYHVNISAHLKKTIQQEDVFISLKNRKEKSNLFTYKITPVVSQRKLHNSPYKIFPINISSGMVMTKKKISGYFAFNGEYEISKSDKVLFGYNSKQFGIHDVQKNIFNLGWLHNKWSLYAGEINQTGIFYNRGNGVKINYQKNKNTGIGASYIKSNYFWQKSSNMTFWGSYSFKQVNIYHEIISNRDFQNHIQSYIDNNRVILADNKKLFLTMNAGIGRLSNYLYKGKDNHFTGVSAGYKFRLNRVKWKMGSEVIYNNDAFPGIYQGYRMNSHFINFLPTKRISIGAEYQSSFYKRFFFRDSIFYQSRLLSNMKSYGLTTGYSSKGINFTLGGGVLTNAVAEDYAAPVYKYGSVILSIPLFNNTAIKLSNKMGYEPHYGINKKSILLRSTAAEISNKWGGLEFLNERLPLFDVFNNSKVFTGYEKIFNIGPYLSMNFPHQRLQGSLQYNYSKILPDTATIQYTSVSLNYYSKKKDLTVGITTSSSNSKNYKNTFSLLTVTKSVGVPKIKSRLYQDFQMKVFEDKNDNSVWDKDEPYLPDITLLINEHPYITNNNGVIKLINTEEGIYLLDFHQLYAANGLIPSNGFLQKIPVSRKTSILIPFKKGKILKGSVKVILDSLSSQKFSPDNIKVIVTDSSGNKFSTLTDNTGKFSIGLPAGKYVVSLNPQAFDETFKPVQSAFTADLLNNEEVNIYFVIKQKQRKVVMIKGG